MSGSVRIESRRARQPVFGLQRVTKSSAAGLMGIPSGSRGNRERPVMVLAKGLPGKPAGFWKGEFADPFRGSENVDSSLGKCRGH